MSKLHLIKFNNEDDIDKILEFFNITKEQYENFKKDIIKKCGISYRLYEIFPKEVEHNYISKYTIPCCSTGDTFAIDSGTNLSFCRISINNRIGGKENLVVERTLFTCALYRYFYCEVCNKQWRDQLSDNFKQYICNNCNKV